MQRKWIVPALLVLCILSSSCGRNNVQKSTFPLSDMALSYEAMPYGEYKEKTGAEAEVYHADRFIGEIPDSALSVVYLGAYDEELGGAALPDEAMPLRLEGSLGALLPDMKEELPLEKFAESLSADGKSAFELLEGAGTAYYVGDRFLQIHFDSDKDGTDDRLLSVSLDESTDGTVKPESAAWLELLR